MSYSTAACKPLRIRFSDIVLRSLAARIESMIVIKDASTSGGTAHMKRSAIEMPISASFRQSVSQSAPVLTRHDVVGNNEQVTIMIGIRTVMVDRWCPAEARSMAAPAAIVMWWSVLMSIFVVLCR